MIFRLPENETYFDEVKIFICKANKGLQSNQVEASTSRKAKLKIKPVIASRSNATAWQSPYLLGELNFSGSLKTIYLFNF